MSMTICCCCHGVFNTDDDPDCFCGPDEDIPVCERCREEEALYENQAQPVKPGLPNVFACNEKHRKGWRG